VLPSLIFIFGAFLLSWIDWKKQIIPDRFSLPLIAILTIVKAFEATLTWSDGVAIVVVLVVFLIPIALNMNFGGGDLRFGAFCALFLGLENIGYFIAGAGLIHLILLGILRRREFGFAPAMSLAALAAWSFGS